MGSASWRYPFPLPNIEPRQRELHFATSGQVGMLPKRQTRKKYRRKPKWESGKNWG